MLPQIRCLITLKIESSIISIDRNIIDNIIRSLMYSRKSVGPRMEPCTTPVLTGYYCWWVGGTGVKQKVSFRAN